MAVTSVSRARSPTPTVDHSSGPDSSKIVLSQNSIALGFRAEALDAPRHFT
jgi:hypothetical protein